MKITLSLIPSHQGRRTVIRFLSPWWERAGVRGVKTAHLMKDEKVGKGEADA
jgi:hypothetical protein